MRVLRPDGGNRDFFVYGTDPIALAANESRPINIPVQSDADFECAYVMGFSSVASPSFTLQISDNSSNLTLSNVPVLDAMIAGTAQRPFVLPETHIFGRTGAILLNLANLTAGANTVRIYLAGWKWFTRPAGLVA